MNDNKSYLEIKVTFTHVMILLVAVIMIGIFLFYIGFNAGKNESIRSKSFKNIDASPGKSDEIRLNGGQNKTKAAKPTVESDIKKELGLFEKSVKSQEKEKPVMVEPIEIPSDKVKDTYYSIQVGSFKSHLLAKNYAKKFSLQGYQTDISQFHSGPDIWFRVKVGRFNTLKSANEERVKLEKMEKRKFQTVKQD